MQIIIADSGSTKTDWAVLSKGGRVKRFKTMGLNPWFVDAKKLMEVLKREVLIHLDSPPSFHGYFFGAGCGSEAHRDLFSDCFMRVGARFIEVETDLVGAARAAFGNGEGLAVILGTGANAGVCKYGSIIETAPSLGYVLGDEGSASWIGKHLLSAYLRHQLPENISLEMETKVNESTESILDHVYKQARPNHYIASFAAVLKGYENEPWVKELLMRGFNAFFCNYVSVISSSKKLPIVAVGSVANAYVDMLADIAGKEGFADFSVLPSVMDGLIDHYLLEVEDLY